MEHKREIDNKKLVDMLKKAYADEWIAGYYYLYIGYFVKGPFSEDIEELFNEVAKEELEEHTKMLADRLQQLGEDPPSDFKSLWDLSPCKFPEVPSDPYNTQGLLKAGVLAEECAMKAYKELYDYVHGVDPVTEEVARHLLADETEHRTKFENMMVKQS